MLRSLFSGITGLRAHQTMMDVTGNNIANVNTAGYKTSQSVFEDTLSQMLRAAGAPQGGVGGTNPAQVGLGVRVAGIATNFSQGAAQNTGRSTDLMISGDGFFVVRNGAENLYTRSGAFSFDGNGTLVGPGGGVVQGWTATNGVVDTNKPMEDVTLPMGTLLPPVATTGMEVGGNLPGDTTSTTPIAMSMTTYDQQGNKVNLTVTFTRSTATMTPPAVAGWDVSVSDGVGTPSTTTLEFDSAGKRTGTSPTSVGFGAVTVDLSGVTNYAGSSTVAALSQNGSAMGSLQSFTISPDGTLVGVFSNGLKQPLAQIALATFNNAPGLEKAGGSMYRTSVNSGAPQLGTAGSGGRGDLQGGSLEMSNVDLAQEFTNLIIAQRGFQANSKVISTSDELLNDLVNLKR
ncbi:flagellar hook protein FlgE [Planosporangium mesophilum]|uniref:Flagellar hook protein FlgE n=1 Tax=Planosporangium mesophilum TaxID=689768 RepID=A0A8J3TI99_9ACTN|nr:flagellar hook protein FlgE [Planosporangium mesophilum]NJC86512.1 flagellar hook protein FlgE [Planosporangium mesophilum]GII26161.1 flagellar hook protein FlgE [Planosporangium mesophilum]